MRTALKQRAGQRLTFTAQVAALARRKAYRGKDLPALLLKDVRFADGSLATNHLWWDQGKWARTLKVGDRNPL